MWKVVLPSLIFLLGASYVQGEKVCSKGHVNERFDCYPMPGATQEKCEARGCCWESTTVSKAPWCFYPDGYSGYTLINYMEGEYGQLMFFNKTASSPYPRDIQNVRVDVEYQTLSRLRIKISDAEEKRFEAPYPKISKEFPGVRNPTYKFDMFATKPFFRVTRGDGDILFDTVNLGGFTFADQFLQISSKLYGRLYGLGEHRTNLWLDNNWETFTLFTHDAAPTENINLYGSHPFYLVMQPSGKSYGVFLHNSNAIDVVLQPLPAITFRAIGGIMDFYIFTGPTPADVIRQYTELIGRPVMPPYWSLGFHLCKYGYGSEEVTRAIWKRNRDAGIPFDVMWNDIDYMKNQNDFTIDEQKFKNLSQLVSDIHSVGMHYIPILDPGVSASEPAGTYPPYDDGIAMDIFIQDHTGKIFIGKVWNPNSTAFPDFTNPKTQEYWTKQIRGLKKKLDFDGLWIDMNEPSNFWDGGKDGCPENELEDPPYLPRVDGGILRKKTICMTAKQYAGLHYDVHNIYGISEHDMTYRALEDIMEKRVFTLSRSSFPGTGTYGGHWSGDVFSDWHDLTKSIPEILLYSLYGMPYTGADICGFNGNATKSLCNRWMQLGAFYPFSRNHNSLDTIHQDPVAFGTDVVNSSIKALKVRYTLLPYLYTLFFHARQYGDTVARPLFFEFPHDIKTHTVDRAFLWGSGLYIIPVTEDVSTFVWAYLPKGKWYDWYSRNHTINSKGQDVKLDAPLDTIPLLVRGGIILPTQKPAQTTTQSRKNEFTFMVFPDDSGLASGDLFWDDGDSLETIESNHYGYLKLELLNDRFTSTVTHWNTEENQTLDSIIIRGFERNVTKVFVNQKEFPFKLEYNVLEIQKLKNPLSESIVVSWK